MLGMMIALVDSIAKGSKENEDKFFPLGDSITGETGAPQKAFMDTSKVCQIRVYSAWN